MFSKHDHVIRKGTDHPVGIIEALKGEGWVTVRWGVADGHEYKEAIHQDDLIGVEYDIFSPEEVEIQQLQNSGAKFREIRDAS